MSRKPFTLIELLTAMAIIAILAAMVLGVSAVVSRNMMEARTKARLEAMMMALQEHFQDRGYYPQPSTAGATIEVDFSVAPFDQFWHSQTERPYLEDTKIKDFSGDDETRYLDGWGREAFRYQLHSTEGYRLWSYGADKKSGTTEEKQDDICSWKQR
ncbi:MAG: prepilin-type N-terminal cleavage/methylation domain-containing protein [Lentisphaerae bacterium]|nr:prepilin-type N-terminal cleavage/methylation domain-containing protein [Lentisphaerota bacterium]